MTVDIQFQPDHRIAGQALPTDPPYLFDWTLLVVPVRFRVEGTDFLPVEVLPAEPLSVDELGIATHSEPVTEEVWTPQPLLGFLRRLHQAVEETRASGASRLNAVEAPDLVFRLRPESILEVRSSNRATSASAPIHEFTIAIASFREASRAWLERDAPHLKAHPAWRDWFPSK